MPNLQIINPVDYPDWDKLILSTEKYTFFHSSVWAKVLSDAYKYKPLYFTELINGGITTLIPILEVNSLLTGKRGISLPFTDHCEPIINREDDFLSVIKLLNSYGKKSGWKYIELRGGKVPPGIAPSSSYCVHTLDLAENAEEIFKTFRSSTKRNIKKAAKEGVAVRISTSANSIKEFYRLNCLTRKKHGLPPQPYYFFRKIFDHILSTDAGFVALASYHDKTIAASVYFHFGKKVIYKYGASDLNYQHLRANNLVMWEAIKWYCENGYENFSFGRTEPYNKGLLQFKAGWAGKQETLNYYKYDLLQDKFVNNQSKITGLHSKILTKMPLFLLRILGSVLYSHVG